MTVGLADARSWLFVPGNRPDRYAKALGSEADRVVVDLEDAVAASEKAGSRSRALAWEGIGCAVLRINAADTPWHTTDLADVIAAVDAGRGPAAIMLPKSDGSSVVAVDAALAGRLPVIALVESARGIRDADAVAAGASVARIAFGSVDHALDIGVTPTPPAEDELLFARSALVNASRAAHIAAPIDGVTVGLDDAALVERDARRSRTLGFTGKLCLHPRQVSAVHHAFAPTDSELAWAHEVMDAVAVEGDSAFRLDGEVIDAPRVAQAREILAARR